MSFAVSLETRPEFLNINKNDRRIPSTIRIVDPTKIQLKKISHKFDIPEQQQKKMPIVIKKVDQVCKNSSLKLLVSVFSL